MAMSRFVKSHTAAALTLCLCLGEPALAQQQQQFAQVEQNGSLIQILAEQSIDIDVETGIYEAVGNVQVLFNETIVFGEQVVASFSTGEESGQLQSFEVTGNVFVSTPQLEGQSASLTANIDTGRLMFGGQQIVLQAEQGRVLANRSVVFDQEENALLISGNAIASIAEATVAGDEIVIQFAEAEGAGGMENLDLSIGEFETLTARGNVQALFDTTQVSADFLQTSGENFSQVVLTGNVVVNQDGALLTGDAMRFDTATGKVTMASRAELQSAGRVSGSVLLTQ